MNERIRELAKQATEDVMKNTPSFLVTNEMWQEKFAELIVRECADIAEKWYSDYPSDDRLLSDAVKQHFGVEQ